jgi:hypothetical protein
MTFAPLARKHDGSPSRETASSKSLRIGPPDDAFEREADRAAEEVLALSAPKFNWSFSRIAAGPPVQRKCSCGKSGECEECKNQPLRRKATGAAESGYAPPIVHQVLRSSGEPLGRSTLDFFEPRFRADFSSVRVHRDSAAGESARAVLARAYTVGRHIVFGPGEYSPDSAGARSLLAHELAHVLQQGPGETPAQLQCKAAPDANSDIKAKIRKSPAYKAEASLTEQIIKHIDKKPDADRPALFQSLFDALNTPVKPPGDIAQETTESTVEATEQEKTRLSEKKQAQNVGIEEAGSADPARQHAWTRMKGKFGGGAYYVDRRSATDIHIRAKIFLHAAGKGTADDVKNVKSMEDAIEKAASTFGYSVDIIFVDRKEPDAFDVSVDPSQWEVATNWAGGDPVGYAHELHHLLAFEIDRYNYIESHSKNEAMKVHDRLIWFEAELRKPAGYDDPTSIMAGAQHPSDSDVCAVAGLDPKTCQEERQDARKVRDRLLDAIQRSDGTDIFVATEMIPDSLRGPMLGDAEVLTAVDSLPAKARVITRARMQFGGNKIPPKVRQLVDAAINADSGKAVELLQKNPDLHGPFASPAANLDGIKAAVVDVFAGDAKKKVEAAAAP